MWVCLNPFHLHHESELTLSDKRTKDSPFDRAQRRSSMLLCICIALQQRTKPQKAVTFDVNNRSGDGFEPHFSPWPISATTQVQLLSPVSADTNTTSTAAYAAVAVKVISVLERPATLPPSRGTYEVVIPIILTILPGAEEYLAGWLPPRPR